MADLEETLQGLVRIGQGMINLNRILAASPVVGEGDEFQILFDNEESVSLSLSGGERMVNDCRAEGLVRAGRALINVGRLLTLEFEPSKQVKTNNPAWPDGFFTTTPQYVARFDVHAGPLKRGFLLPAEEGKALLSLLSNQGQRETHPKKTGGARKTSGRIV
jgi:hypothetical protein